MISIDENIVNELAPNANAIKNGRKLVVAGKLLSRQKTADDTLLFGECKGSGKANYHCSVDFIDPDHPVGRCSCPSRQFPCKHALAILYAYLDGETFETAVAPEDVLQKREKATERAAKKKATSKAPRKTNKSALKKKLAAQLEGIDLLQTLTHDLVARGLGNFNAKAAKEVETHARQLGNKFVPGAEAALRELTALFRDASIDEERRYVEAVERLTRLHTLVRRGRDHLSARREDESLLPAIDSSIAAWLGHVWELRELRELRQFDEDVELAQLSFFVRRDEVRKQFVDTGLWIDLGLRTPRRNSQHSPLPRSKAHQRE